MGNTLAPSIDGAGSLARAISGMVASVCPKRVFTFVNFAGVAVLEMSFKCLWADTTITLAPSTHGAVSCSIALLVIAAFVWSQFVFGFVNKAFLVDWSLSRLAVALSSAPSGSRTGSLT